MRKTVNTFALLHLQFAEPALTDRRPDSQEFSGGWKQDEATEWFPLLWSPLFVLVSAVCFRQCFHTVNWVTGKACSL